MRRAASSTSSARLRSVTLLCRDATALSRAHDALLGLGLSSAWAPRAGHAALCASAGVSLGQSTTLELVAAAPSVHWRWPSEASALRLVSANLVADAAGDAAHDAAGGDAASDSAGGAADGDDLVCGDVLAALLGGGGEGAGTLLASVGLGRWMPQAPVGPVVTLSAARPQRGVPSRAPAPPVAASLSLAEVVLGADSHALFVAAQRTLEAAGAAHAAAVWRLPHAASAPLRLLPGRSSALSLACGAEALEALTQRLRLPLRGERRGAVGTGAAHYAAVSTLPALAGLDLRLVEAGAAAPSYFVEPSAAMDEDVDPAMNDPEDPRKQQSLSCASVAGMDLVSTIRMRLRGLGK